MAWSTTKITRDNGETVEAQAPIIVSASRSTDIPGFYADWFFSRLEKGYSAWLNPFNGLRSFVSYEKTKFIVFWSKNPANLLPHLDKLAKRKIKCYIQYTLNDYEKERLEKEVPPLQERINTFKMLVTLLGKGSVIWRFDPLILTDKISMADLLHKIQCIGDKLAGYTDKLVFSFADISIYKKVKYNLEINNINYAEWTEPQMLEFAKKLSEMNKARGWNYELATCGEKPIFHEFGIKANHCIDDNLIIRLSYEDSELMKFLGVIIKDNEKDLFGTEKLPEGAIKLSNGQYAIKTKDNKDKGQRSLCQCVISKDIGEYNTCTHFCEYCYANTNKLVARANYMAHMKSPYAETITGK